MVTMYINTCMALQVIFKFCNQLEIFSFLYQTLCLCLTGFGEKNYFDSLSLMLNHCPGYSVKILAAASRNSEFKDTRKPENILTPSQVLNLKND